MLLLNSHSFAWNFSSVLWLCQNSGSMDPRITIITWELVRHEESCPFPNLLSQNMPPNKTFVHIQIWEASLHICLFLYYLPLGFPLILTLKLEFLLGFQILKKKKKDTHTHTHTEILSFTFAWCHSFYLACYKKKKANYIQHIYIYICIHTHTHTHIWLTS